MPRRSSRCSIALGMMLVVCSLCSLADDDAADWIDVLREGRALERKEAREALIAMGEAAVAPLIEAIGDEDFVVRWEAVNALGFVALDDPDSASVAIPTLVERALTDDSSQVRSRSLWALSTFSEAVLGEEELVSDEVVPLLLTGLDDPDDQRRWNATVGLGYFSRPQAAPLLNEGLDRDDVYEAWQAVFYLGLVHDDESVSLLIAVMLDVEGRDVTQRREVALTLGKIGDPDAIPALTEALEDPEPEVRWRAAQSLAGLVGASSLPVLNDALARETDEPARQQMERIIADLERAP
jgi:HEAT repeat protein